MLSLQPISCEAASPTLPQKQVELKSPEKKKKRTRQAKKKILKKAVP